MSKLGLTKDAYLNLVARALSPRPSSEISELGKALNEDLKDILPERQVRDSGKHTAAQGGESAAASSPPVS